MAGLSVPPPLVICRRLVPSGSTTTMLPVESTIASLPGSEESEEVLVVAVEVVVALDEGVVDGSDPLLVQEARTTTNAFARLKRPPMGGAYSWDSASHSGGAAIEIKLPIPVIDLRIPIGLRLSYTPSVPSGYSERLDLTTLTYRSEWKYAFNFTVGAVLFF